MNRSVEILMSTYNGEKYLIEQLDSILAQTHGNLILTIRDDGSKDSTSEILSSYATADKRIRLVLQDNLGIVGSFYWLLKNADSECQFFAFADQDDVWLPNKVERALNVLSGYDQAQPLLYCSRVEYVSADLSHLAYSPMIKARTGLRNALVQNVFTGCTVVMNNAAHKLLLKHNWPQQVFMHDWWSYLVISAFGKVINDDFVSIKYRQHGGNVVGGTVSFMSDYRNRIINFFNRQKNGVFGCYDQAYAFWTNYQNEFQGESREIVRLFIESKRSFLHRLKYLLCEQRAYRHTCTDDFIVRLLILVNKY